MPKLKTKPVRTRDLPDKEIALLAEMYMDNAQVFRARLHQLYKSGYRPAEIYHAVQRMPTPTTTTPDMLPSRATIRAWSVEPNVFFDHAASAYPIPAAFYPIPPTLTALMHHARAYRQIPPAERPEFIRLAELTRQLRGLTPEDSPLREAKNTFDALVNRYYAQGIRISDIARVAGVTHRAIALRLREV